VPALVEACESVVERIPGRGGNEHERLGPGREEPTQWND
jgi:hypothetical protein